MVDFVEGKSVGFTSPIVWDSHTRIHYFYSDGPWIWLVVVFFGLFFVAGHVMCRKIGQQRRTSDSCWSRNQFCTQNQKCVGWNASLASAQLPIQLIRVWISKSLLQQLRLEKIYWCVGDVAEGESSMPWFSKLHRREDMKTSGMIRLQFRKPLKLSSKFTHPQK